MGICSHTHRSVIRNFPARPPRGRKIPPTRETGINQLTFLLKKVPRPGLAGFRQRWETDGQRVALGRSWLPHRRTRLARAPWYSEIFHVAERATFRSSQTWQGVHIADRKIAKYIYKFYGKIFKGIYKFPFPALICRALQTLHQDHTKHLQFLH